MKMLKTAFVLSALAIGIISYGQEGLDTTKPLPNQPRRDTMMPRPRPDTIRPKPRPDTPRMFDVNYNNKEVNNQGITSADTVQPDAVNKPNFGRYYIPAIGTYTSSTETSGFNKSVTIIGDEENAGKIWIEGLTDQRIYALRKSGAGIYKIPAQAGAPEGTLMYDDANKQVNICIGRKYVESNPAEAFNPTTTEKINTNTKKKKNTKSVSTKTTVITFTGNKTENGTVSVN